MSVASQSVAAPKSLPKILILGGILLALSAPLITWILDGYFRLWFDRDGKVLAGLVAFWVIIGVVLLLIRLEYRNTNVSVWHLISFKRVKLRESLVILIIGFVTLFFANVAFVILARTIFPTEIRTSPALALPLPLVILAYLTGVIGEEILYRGYALEQLQRITGKWWISGGITGLLFIGFHIPAYPMAHIIGFVLPSTVVLTLVYIWKRSLTYTIMIHGVLNLPILMAAILLPLLSQG